MSQNDPTHVAALLERIGRLLSTDAHSHGLNPVQWEALRYLGKANRFSDTVIALATYLGLTKGTVSQSVISLEKKGLIRKVAAKHDKRSLRLLLTTQGKQQLKSDPLSRMAAELLELPEVARNQLGNTLTALLSARLTANNRQPFGQCLECRYFGRDHAEGGPHRCLLIEEKLSEADSQKICIEQTPLK